MILTGSDLTLDEVVRVARERERVELHADAAERMLAARTVVEAHLEAGTPVYGMTTGVAARKRHPVPLEKQDEHNRLLVQDLLVGQGPEASEEVVRATILRLVNGFARGTSGMRPLIADRLVEALNNGAHPPVAMLGSVGMADLAQMAQLAHGVLGDLTLAPKDAISLVDNDAFSTALAALAIHDYGRLLDAFDTAGALDLEAFGANLTILHAAVGREHPYVGLQTTIERLRRPARGQLPLGRRRRPKSPGSAELPLPAAGARRRAGGARLRRAAARDRAQRLAGEPARRARGVQDHVRRQLRSARARDGARLPPHRARARRHRGLRADDQAHAEALLGLARGTRARARHPRRRRSRSSPTSPPR